MLGRTLQEEFKDYELIIADRDNCDITDASSFHTFFESHKPDIVIHAAAMTAVDDCESNIDNAYKINAIGSANVALCCDTFNARLIAISTDYVFDGLADDPYNEYDTPAPQTIYGKSKYAGEEAVRRNCANHVIARISWLYGPKGPSFIHTMMKLADGTRANLKVVSDQIGNPTSTFAVASALRNILENESIRGTIHLTCEGSATWYELTSELFRQKGVKQNIIKCSTEEFPRPAKRPHNSRLDKMNLRLLGLPQMPDWKDALADFLKKEEF